MWPWSLLRTAATALFASTEYAAAAAAVQAASAPNTLCFRYLHGTGRYPRAAAPTEVEGQYCNVPYQQVRDPFIIAYLPRYISSAGCARPSRAPPWSRVPPAPTARLLFRVHRQYSLQGAYTSKYLWHLLYVCPLAYIRRPRLCIVQDPEIHQLSTVHQSTCEWDTLSAPATV